MVGAVGVAATSAIRDQGTGRRTAEKQQKQDQPKHGVSPFRGRVTARASLPVEWVSLRLESPPVEAAGQAPPVLAAHLARLRLYYRRNWHVPTAELSVS
jgi:hypothetical protein